MRFSVEPADDGDGEDGICWALTWLERGSVWKQSVMVLENLLDLI